MEEAKKQLADADGYLVIGRDCEGLPKGAEVMDGVALCARDSFGATDTTPVTLREGQFTVVDTGDPIPEGCDAVIIVEELVQNDDGSVTIHTPAAPWQHIRQIGMGACLVMAEEMGAYILTDKATFLTFVANDGVMA